jgi:hypothetical protein
MGTTSDSLNLHTLFVGTKFHDMFAMFHDS